MVNYIGDHVDFSTYAAELDADAAAYNGFQLIGIEREQATENAASDNSNNSDWKLLMTCNRQSPYTKLLYGKGVSGQSGAYVQTFASASLSEAYPKMVISNRRFASIMNRLDSFADTETLFDELENSLLKCLLTQLANEGELQQAGLPNRSANLGCDDRLDDVFVSIPEVRYGTRTHTLIAVDAQGQCTIRERTLIEPIQLKQVHNQAAWHTTRCTVQF